MYNDDSWRDPNANSTRPKPSLRNLFGPKLFSVIGALCMLDALGAWSKYYTRADGAHLGNYVACIAYTTQTCRYLDRLGSFLGHAPYSPLVFWIGVGLFALGFIIRRQKPASP